MFILKPELPKEEHLRNKALEKLFRKWVVDIPNRKIKPTAYIFKTFYGINQYVSQMQKVIKEVKCLPAKKF